MGEPVQDCSSDIYSLGCALFYLLSGQAPYSGPDADHVAREHMAGGAKLTKSSGVELSVRKLVKSMMEAERESS